MCTQEFEPQLPLGAREMTWKSGPGKRARARGQAAPTVRSQAHLWAQGTSLHPAVLMLPGEGRLASLNCVTVHRGAGDGLEGLGVANGRLICGGSLEPYWTGVMQLAPEVAKEFCSCGHTFHPNRTWAVGPGG